MFRDFAEKENEMNSGEARVIRDVTKQCAKMMPAEADILMRKSGVHHEISILKQAGKDPAVVEVVGKDNAGKVVKEGDEVVLKCRVSCIHEVLDEQTGEVIGWNYSLDFVRKSGSPEHLGCFHFMKVLK